VGFKRILDSEGRRVNDLTRMVTLDWLMLKRFSCELLSDAIRET